MKQTMYYLTRRNPLYGDLEYFQGNGEWAPKDVDRCKMRLYESPVMPRFVQNSWEGSEIHEVQIAV